MKIKLINIDTANTVTVNGPEGFAQDLQPGQDIMINAGQLLLLSIKEVVPADVAPTADVPAQAEPPVVPDPEPIADSPADVPAGAMDAAVPETSTEDQAANVAQVPDAPAESAQAADSAPVADAPAIDAPVAQVVTNPVAEVLAPATPTLMDVEAEVAHIEEEIAHVNQELDELKHQ